MVVYVQYNQTFLLYSHFQSFVCPAVCLKRVMFARATFLQRKSACAVESRPFALMSDTGPV